MTGHVLEILRDVLRLATSPGKPANPPRRDY
jgi:hypothetical protein